MRNNKKDNMENGNVWVIVLIVILILVLFGGFGGMMGGYGMMGGLGFGFMPFGFLFMLAFLVFIIWIIVTLINPQSKTDERLDSLTILKQRYAKGEISKKEYERMKKELLKI